jgi:hypothetical protein
MEAELTRLIHKMEKQLHRAAESCIICILAPGGQSGNFWTHPRMLTTEQSHRDWETRTIHF